MLFESAAFFLSSAFAISLSLWLCHTVRARNILWASLCACCSHKAHRGTKAQRLFAFLVGLAALAPSSDGERYKAVGRLLCSYDLEGLTSCPPDTLRRTACRQITANWKLRLTTFKPQKSVHAN